MQIHHHLNQMFKRLTLLVSQNKLLLLAIIISLILHSLVFTKFSISWPKLNVTHQMLEMRLVKLPAPQKTTSKPVIKKTPPPAPPMEKTTPIITPPDPIPVLAPIPTPAQEVVPEAEMPATAENILDARPLQTPQEASPIVAEPVETIIEQDIKEYTPKAYQYVETRFEVRRGSDATAAGEATIVFKMQDESTYNITSLTEAKGLASLFFGKLIQTSEGSITEKGLRPNHYRYQYGNNEKKSQYANLAWSDGVIEMHSSKGIRTESIAEGTQDLLSFMYQFMFTPPLANMQITMTNGKNLSTYTYSFEGEESISTKLGDLKTIHILKSGDEDEKTELWLASEYQNLPIKIRKTEKNGNIIEQLATNMKIKRID